MEQKIKLDFLFKKVYSVLSRTRTKYLLIGGLASSVLGEPRFTQDADFLIYIHKKELEQFLNALGKKGLKFDKKEIEKSVVARGVFRIFLGDYHADFIINALKIGNIALKRAIEVKLFNKQVKLPTAEDLILFKLLACRPLDLIDVKNIYLRNEEKLDRDYMLKQAQIICDETENMKVWNELQKLIK